MSSAVLTARATWNRGALLVAGATLVWSSAGLLARWVHTDPWTTLFWRSIFAFLALVAWLVLREGRALPARFAGLGLAGWAMAACFAISMITFITALNMTTVAAVMMFQAAAPLFAAVLAWLFLHERVGRQKLLAIVATLAGVGVMVSGGQGQGWLAGNLLSFVMGLTFAGTIVLARARADVPTTEATCLAVVMVMAVAAPFARFSLAADDMLLLASFGVVQMGLALIMFTTGVRLLPAADAGLISVLEAVLAPLWVWLAFDEDPGPRTLLGGAIVIAAVVVAVRAER